MRRSWNERNVKAKEIHLGLVLHRKSVYNVIASREPGKKANRVRGDRQGEQVRAWFHVGLESAECGRRASQSRARRRARIAARRPNAGHSTPHPVAAVLGHTARVTRRRARNAATWVRRHSASHCRRSAWAHEGLATPPVSRRTGRKKGGYGTHVHSTRGSCAFSFFGGGGRSPSSSHDARRRRSLFAPRRGASPSDAYPHSASYAKGTYGDSCVAVRVRAGADAA